MILTGHLNPGAVCVFAVRAREQLSDGSILNRRIFWLGIFYASNRVLTMLAKGLAGIALAGGIIGLYLLMSRRLRSFIGFHLIWGCLLALGVCFDLVRSCDRQHGYLLLMSFLFSIISSGSQQINIHHPGPFYYYAVAIVIAVFPFAFCADQRGSYSDRSQYVTNGIDAIDRWKLFAFLWMLFPVVFFSFSGSKLPAYILPAVPGCFPDAL